MKLLKENCTDILFTKKAVGFNLKEFQTFIWFPKSQLQWMGDIEKADTFIVPDWLWDKKVDELYNI